mgnify:CR=1 FL=1
MDLSFSYIDLLNKRIQDFCLEGKNQKEISDFFQIEENDESYELQKVFVDETHLYWKNIRIDFKDNFVLRIKFFLQPSTTSNLILPDLFKAKKILLHEFLLELNQQKITWSIDELSKFNEDYLIIKIRDIQVYFYLKDGKAIEMVCSL